MTYDADRDVRRQDDGASVFRTQQTLVELAACATIKGVRAANTS